MQSCKFCYDGILKVSGNRLGRKISDMGDDKIKYSIKQHYK